jgi:hypothetical protein
VFSLIARIGRLFDSLDDFWDGGFWESELDVDEPFPT